jgi:hypothetical protein
LNLNGGQLPAMLLGPWLLLLLLVMLLLSL